MARKTKFVIFGQSRTGSTLLVLLLRSHPEVHCDRELLNLDHEYVRGRLALELSRVVPFPLVYSRLARSRTRVYGFKLMVGHARALGLTLSVLHRLGWRVIHIHREDIVAQSLSELVARQTRRWRRSPGELLPLPRIRIEPDELIGEVQNRLKHRTTERLALDEVPHLRLVYERDLLDERAWEETARTLCRYLGIAEQKLNADIAKSYDEPYERIVEDGQELLRRVEAAIGSRGREATSCGSSS